MADRRLKKPHYKTVIFASYLELLKKHCPDVNIADLVQEAGLSLEYISDQNNWVSVTFEKQFMDLVCQKIGERNIYFEAGQHGVSRTGLGEGLYFLAANIIPLDTIYKSLPKLTALLNKVITVEILESRNGYFKFQFKPNLEELNEEEAEILVSRMPLVMENTRGYYSELPTVKQLPPAQIGVEILDGDAGIYTLEVKYFAAARVLGLALKSLPVFAFAAVTALIHYFAQTNWTDSLLYGYSAVITAIISYLTFRNRRLWSVAIRTEETLYSVDTQNKELYDAKNRLQRKLEESLANYQLVTHLISASMEEEVLQLGCACLVDNLNYDRAFILLYDREQNCLRLSASKGLTPKLEKGMKAFALPVDINDLDPAKFTNVFKLKKPLLVKDVRAHMEKLKDPTSLQVLQASGTRSFVAAPIYTQSHSLGILVADCVSKQKIMTDDDLKLISTAAQQIAIGIEQQRSKQELVESYQKEMELSESYSRFVPFETLAILNYKSIFDVKIGDYVDANVTIMFSDIRGFTTLCETMSPSDILKFLNSYYGRLSPIIKAHGGTIDKFMGDGVMAIFPKPEMALGAAVDIQRAIFKYNLQERVHNRVPIQAGVGIASGRVVFGPLGSDKRLELTAIADTVNVASRLDGLCRETGQNIMITGIDEQTLTGFPHLKFSHLQPLHVKGRLGEVSVIAVADEQLFESFQVENMNEMQTNYLSKERESWEKRRKAS